MAVAPLVAGAAGLQMASSLLQAKGQAEAYRFSEEKAQRQARAARTAADETDAFLRDELDTTLGNIAAISAAAGRDASSPTSLAVIAEETRVSDRQRRIKVGNLQAQAAQSESDAAYYRHAARSVWGPAIIGGLAGATKTLAGGR